MASLFLRKAISLSGNLTNRFKHRRHPAAIIGLLLLCLLHSGCATMVFHNYPVNNTQTLVTIENISIKNAPINQQASEKIFPNRDEAMPESGTLERHQVKSGETIMAYFGGKTNTIELVQWCGKRPWVRLKTEQSTMDMFVRWLASPFYAINSVEVDCEPKKNHPLAQVNLKLEQTTQQ